MNSLDKSYQELINTVINNGTLEQNRTGISSIAIPSAMIVHDMEDGFPLMTHKKLPFKTISVELEGFIKGVTSKKWFQERGCNIWNQWCNPLKVPYMNDPDQKTMMEKEDDLGLIYGAQWRDFHNPTASNGSHVDQLIYILSKLASNPSDRRMICSSWNPAALDRQALPPCHVLWQVQVINKKLHLSWFQRSCDLMLGIPFNIASYGLLLTLLSNHSGYKVGTLTGFLSNVHIYENQLDAAHIIKNLPFDDILPSVEFSTENIFEWNHTKCSLCNYFHGPKIEIPLAV